MNALIENRRTVFCGPPAFCISENGSVLRLDDGNVQLVQLLLGDPHAARRMGAPD